MKNSTKKLGLGSAALSALLLVGAAGPTRAQQRELPSPPDFARGLLQSGGWLGVSVEEVTPDKAKELKLRAEYGVYVSNVGENSPAAKAGLKKGDVITEYNGERIEGTAEFRREVRETPPGRVARMSIWREGRTQKLSAEVGQSPAPNFDPSFGRGPNPVPRDFDSRGPRDFDSRRNPQLPAPGAPGAPGSIYGRRGFADGPTLGVGAQDLSGQLGEYFGAPEGEGVLVTEVRQGTPGEKAGLKAGDVITKVNGERVHNVGELRGRLRDIRDSKNVTLGVLRKGTETSLTAEVEASQPPRGGPRRGADSGGFRIPI